jgi:hypothetical protein
MALTIKNLGKRVLTTGGGDLVPTVASGKSTLVENIIFVNKTGTARTITVEVYDNGITTSMAIVNSRSIGANDRWVLEPVTLNAAQKITGSASAASAID